MQIKENVNLAKLNSFRSGNIARYFCECESVDDVMSAIDFAKNNNLEILIIGEGTNTLFVDNCSDLLVKIKIETLRFEPDRVVAGAGLNWDNFVFLGLKNGLYGLENLSLIPGSLGAAPVQNIGAYGVEVADFIEEVRCLDVNTKEVKILSKKACNFGYRDSIFKHNKNLIILEVVFNLNKNFVAKNDYGELKNINFKDAFELRDKVIEIRKNKLPDHKKVRNAGSFFKNPIVEKSTLDKLILRYPDVIYFNFEDRYKISAGYLIEKFFHKRGFVSDGGVGLWHNQALVLYATDDAKSQDVYDFSQEIIEKIKSETGVEVEREINVIK